jgi:WD40 repeat protein
VSAVAFGPKGTVLASASSDDGTIRLWHPATRKQIGRLTGPPGPVNAVVFSPDAKTLASAGSDGTIRLWNPATGKQLGRLTGHTGSVDAVAFTGDGKTLASAGSDRTVRLWNQVLWRSQSELRTSVCDVVVSGLSHAEWSQYAPGIRYRRSCP